MLNFSLVFQLQESQDQSDQTMNNLEEPFQCTQCQKSFSGKHILQNHIKIVHQGIKHACNDCPKVFAYAFDLRQHINVVHLHKSHDCPNCEKKFLKVQNFRKHMKNVHGVTPKKMILPCDQCDRSFGSEFKLEKHIKKIHQIEDKSDDKEQIQIIEGPESNQEKSVQQSEAMNTTRNEVSELKESFCDEMLDFKQVLDHHQTPDPKQSNLDTIQVKTELCESCGMIFNSKKVLECHMEVVHDNQQDDSILPELCESCGEMFQSVSDLKLHVKVKHSASGNQENEDTNHNKNLQLLSNFVLPMEEQTIETDSKPFQEDLEKLNEEPILDNSQSITKEYQCQPCNKVFQSLQGWKYHQASVHEKLRFSCSDCNQTFTSKRSLSKHNCRQSEDKENEDQNFQCEQCPKSFANATRLYAHVIRNHSNVFHDCDRCGKRFKRTDHLKKHQNRVCKN